MKILVTGGAGFIGSHTVVELQNAGHDVVIVDNLCNSSRKSLARVKRITGKSAKFYKVDIRNERKLNAILVADVDLVEGRRLARYPLHARKRLARAVAEIVDDHDVVAGVLQLHDRVASDESGSAGD